MNLFSCRDALDLSAEGGDSVEMVGEPEDGPAPAVEVGKAVLGEALEALRHLGAHVLGQSLVQQRDQLAISSPTPEEINLKIRKRCCGN